MHSRLDLHHGGHCAASVIMMLLVCYDVYMLGEMDVDATLDQFVHIVMVMIFMYKAI